MQIIDSKTPLEAGLFGSIDDKIDKLIQRDKRKKSGSIRWSGREDPELSESVLRSMVLDKDMSREHPHPLRMDSSYKSLKSFERTDHQQTNTILPSPKILHMEYFGASNIPSERDKVSQGPSSSHGLSIASPVDKPCYIFPSQENQPILPLLQKTKSKKSLSQLSPLPAPPLVFGGYLERAQETCRVEVNNASSAPTLIEINEALQNILDDLSNSSPLDLVLQDSTRRDIGEDELWDLESPKSADGQKEANIDQITESILQLLITGLKSPPWSVALARIGSHKGGLADKFQEIDDLLGYEESPKVSREPVRTDKRDFPNRLKSDLKEKKIVSEKTVSPTNQNSPFIIDMHAGDLELPGLSESRDGEDGEDEQSETVYGIRTNFNAVNEYLNLLLKFLRERLPQLALPASKDSSYLILAKVHKLEKECREDKERDQAVKNIVLPKRPGKKERGRSFERPAPSDSPLSADLFLTLEEDILVVSELSQSSYKDMNILDELFDMQRIYHRAIFDCFAEGLQSSLLSSTLSLEETLLRGIKNQAAQEAPTALPLKVGLEDGSRATTQSKLIAPVEWLEKAKEWVLDCATILAGIIREKEDSMMGNIRTMEPEFVQQLREDRMYRMITLANMEREKEWGSKKDYEVLVKNELTEQLLDLLVGEAIADFNSIALAEHN